MASLKGWNKLLTEKLKLALQFYFSLKVLRVNLNFLLKLLLPFVISVTLYEKVQFLIKIGKYNFSEE